MDIGVFYDPMLTKLIEDMRMLRKAYVGVSTNVEVLRTLAEPAPDVLPESAIFVALRDYPKQQTSNAQSPWTARGSRRFGGDEYERVVLLTDDSSPSEAEPMAVRIKSLAGGLFDIEVNYSTGSPVEYVGVSAKLISPTSLYISLTNKLSTGTIISHPPTPSVRASLAHNTK
ncbi:hypothetical protein EV361DRAFT_979321 [Lentinula raphanica]|nr:hypothetical protein EV361DRAFT_979321 [Lentinula raphanica]